MATLIRKKQQITRKTIDNYNRKLVHFADDTTCILNNVNSIEHLFCTLKYFGQILGQKLNMEKSVLYWVGPWKQKFIPQNISVTIETGCIIVLGVYIANDNNTNMKENFRVKLASMTNNLNMWKFRNLRLAWLTRIIRNKSWCSIANLHFKKYGGLDFLKFCNYDGRTLAYLPEFYKKDAAIFKRNFSKSRKQSDLIE